MTPCYATLYEDWLVKYREYATKDNATIDDMMRIRAARMIPLMAEPSHLLRQVMWEMDRDGSKLLLEDFKILSVGVSDEQQEGDDEMNTADDFFNAYPECIKHDEDHSEDDEEEEEKDLNAAQLVLPVSIEPQQVECSGPPHGSQNQQQIHVDAPQSPRLHNPYAAPKQHPPPSSRGGTKSIHHLKQQNVQQTQNPYDSSQHASTDNSSWEVVSNMHNQHIMPRRAPANNSTWDVIPTVHNPFQSAAQFQYNVDDASEQENRSHPPSNKHHSSSFDQPQTTQSLQTKIPDSLKRKFQPPKKTNEGSHKRGPVGGQTPRPSSRSGEKKETDDDDLPEALKGLDKELIEKIENEILDSGDTVTFDDIAGLDHAKATVQELVCWPMKRPDLFTGLRRGPNGLLLYGPPGTGKTLIGKAVAHESGATFFSISSSSLTSKWIGEGEKLVRTLFAVAAYREPAVVFIDEIDSLLTQRKSDENEASRRIKTEFLVQLDGTGGSKGRVLVIGATNRPHELDDAARRRFVKRLYIPLPAAPDRETLIRTLLGKNKHSLTDACIEKLSIATDGFSGADLKALCVEAAMGPLRGLGARALEVDAKDVPHIAYKHFRQALRGMNPSVSQADLEVYIEWTKTYGSIRANPVQEDDDSDGGD
jgi:fidgetin-like protein 1